MTEPEHPVHSGYADVNGLHYYYEIEGSGDPVLLLQSPALATTVLAFLDGRR